MKKGLLIMVALMLAFAAIPSGKDLSLSISQTKELSKLQIILAPSGSVKCSVNIRIYRLEHCKFQVRPDVEKLENFLLAKGWSETKNDRYSFQKIKAWCSEEGTIYFGRDENNWDLTFNNAPGNEKCRNEPPR